jgi:hypothetical protein
MSIYNKKDFETRSELIKTAEMHLDSEEFDLSILGPKDDIHQCSIWIVFPHSETQVSSLNISKRRISVELKERFRPSHNVGGINFAANENVAETGFVEKNEDMYENLYLVPSFNKKVIQTVEQYFDSSIQNAGMIADDQLKESIRDYCLLEESIFNSVLNLGNYSIEKGL